MEVTSGEDVLRMVQPTSFELPPGAARVLLRILRKELARAEWDEAETQDLWNREVLAS
jgi:hypothetical protein